MYLEIITPETKVFEGEIVGVNVPGSKGPFELLENHAAIISTLGKGTIRVRTKQGEKSFLVDGGVMELLDNKAIILAESIAS